MSRASTCLGVSPVETQESQPQSMLTTTPPSNMHPTIVVPVLVAFGNGTPCACRAALRVWLVKSKPGMFAVGELSQLSWGWSVGDLVACEAVFWMRT